MAEKAGQGARPDPEVEPVAGGEQESGAGYGNNAGQQSATEPPIDTGLKGGASEGDGSDQR